MSARVRLVRGLDSIERLPWDVLADPSTHVYDLLAAIAPYARSYCGIGVQEGHCVEAVAKANSDISLLLCDTWGPVHGGTNRGSGDHVLARVKATGHQGWIELLNGRSQDLIPTLPRETHWDLAFVDGDHSTEGALQDLVSVWERTDLAMVVHDVGMPEVITAFWMWITHLPPPVSARAYAWRPLVTWHPEGTQTAIVWRVYP